jgi:hypothetical protein
MLHAYVERFDVMGGRENILGWDGEVNKPLVVITQWIYFLATWRLTAGENVHAAVDITLRI